MGVCSHYTYNASNSPFYAINPPTILFWLYTNQYCESVTLTFSVAVTYAYNTFAYIIQVYKFTNAFC